MKHVSALIVAHPGHELLLHHWMERNHPLVFVLTDGSGSRGVGRTSFSAQVVTQAGGVVGPVFGVAPDRHWYEAILAQDLGFFQSIAQRIGESCIERGVTRIVADSVELFNPMHDLCAAVAWRVAGMFRETTAPPVELFDYAIELPQAADSTSDLVIELDEDALARKWAAAASIDPLADEVARHRARRNHAVERLRRVERTTAWPFEPPREPHYEWVGKERIASGAYQSVITYARHVRPLAVLLGAA